MRQAEKGEIDVARKVVVQLAVGEAELHMSQEGTLLHDGPVQPILPMACLPALGCVVTWDDKGIAIKHLAWGQIPVKLRGACPEISAPLAVSLIRDYEALHREQAAFRIQKVKLWDEARSHASTCSGKEAVDSFQSLRANIVASLCRGPKLDRR